MRNLIARAADGGGLADQDPALLAPALVGALLDALAGPLAVPPQDAGRAHAQQLTLLALRGLGVPDPRARGLVVQADAQTEDSGRHLYSRMVEDR